MTDNRTIELREKLTERGVEFATDDSAASKVTMWTTQNGGWMFDCDYMEPLNEKPGTIGAKTELMIYGYTPEQAIAATLGISNETAKVLIDDMLDFIGNCCETKLDCDCCDPIDCKYLSGDGELAECTRYQDFLSRAKAIATTLGSEFNPDGLPVGLTISDDSNLLNWRGENYVKQNTLGSGTLTAEQVEEAVYRNCKFYEGGEVDVESIVDELNVALGESKRAVCSECGTLLSDYILCTPCAEKFAVKR